MKLRDLFLLACLLASIGFDVSNADTCTKPCETKFGYCVPYYEKRDGMTKGEAYNQCRGQVDKGKKIKNGCVPYCTDTEKMAALRDDGTGRSELRQDAGTCTKSCETKFGYCVPFYVDKKGMTQTEAYNMCRGQIDKGNKIKNGCLPKCTDTDKMAALRGDDDSGSNDANDPGICAKSCETKFGYCVPFYVEKKGMKQGEAYNMCRSQIDRGSKIKNGCVPKCKDTDKMAALNGDENTESDDTSDDSGSDKPNGKLTFKSNKEGDMQFLCEDDLCKQFGKERGKEACRVKFDIPEKCAGPAGKSCSLLFFFHGGNGNNNVANFKDQVRGKYPGKGFIGVYPQGVEKQWNTGSQAKIPQIDEGPFVTAIVSTLKKHYNWNGLKFAAGYSNGAAQVNRIAVNSGYGFDGIAAAASQLIASPPTGGPGKFDKNTITEKTKPIPYLSLFGSEDPIIPAEGGSSKVFSKECNYILSSVADTMKDFATLNGCVDANDPKDVTTIMATAGGKKLDTTVTRYDCDDSLPVQGVMVIGGGHGVAGNIDRIPMKQYIFNWFLALRSNL